LPIFEHKPIPLQVRKLPAPEDLKLRQVRFLRQVEQMEWSARPQEHRGSVVALRRYQGAMDRRFSATESEGEWS